MIATSFINPKSGNIYSLLIHINDKAEALLIGNTNDRFVRATGYDEHFKFSLIPGTNKSISDGADPLKVYSRLIVQGSLSLSDVLP